jgi:hypothetical protein
MKLYTYHMIHLKRRERRHPVQHVVYAAYVDGTLASIAVLNLRSYTAGSGTRPGQTFIFSVPGTTATSATVRMLEAASSDALSGITFDGYFYDYSLDEGKPVLLSNVTRGGTVAVCGGVVSVTVEDAGSVILDFDTATAGGPAVVESSSAPVATDIPTGSVAARSESTQVSTVDYWWMLLCVNFIFVIVGMT